MTYRDANLSDLPTIVDIYNSTIPGRLVTADTSPVTVADKLKWFQDHAPETRPLWMVEKDNQVIGWVSFQDFYGRPAYNGTAEISIYLKDTEQGKGYGKMILQHAISMSNSLGIHSLLGFIFSHNLPSIHLFLNQGFTEWGELKDVAIMDNKNYSLKIFGKKIKSA